MSEISLSNSRKIQSLQEEVNLLRSEIDILKKNFEKEALNKAFEAIDKEMERVSRLKNDYAASEGYRASMEERLTGLKKAKSILNIVIEKGDKKWKTY